ncbi:MAG: efflux RND transporter periplasmic adaptor subunit, partial [Pseudomonadota bacterium]
MAAQTMVSAWWRCCASVLNVRVFFLLGALALTAAGPRASLAQTNDAVVPVTVAAFSEVAIAIEHDAAAIVESRNRSVLAAELSAPVAIVHADVGSIVSTGDMLVTLDDTDAQLVLRRARAERAQAEADVTLANTRLTRGRALAEDAFVSPDELTELETRVQSAEAVLAATRVSVAEAEEQLHDTVIRAPFDAVVNERAAQVGALVSAGEAVMTITQLTDLEVSGGVSPTELASLRTAGTAILVTSTGRYDTRLLRASPVLEPNSGLHLVRLSFPNGAPAIGETGQLLWNSPPVYLPVAL